MIYSPVSANPLLILLSWVFYLLALVVIVRVIISWIPGVKPWNPFVRVIRQVGDVILAPFRRVLPTFSSIDLSPLLAIIVLQELGSVVNNIAYAQSVSVADLLGTVAGQLVLNLIIIVCVVVLLRVVLSLFHADPWHPMTLAIREISRPFVRPFTGVAVATRTASVDSTAVIAFIAYLLLYFVVRAAFRALFPSVFF